MNPSPSLARRLLDGWLQIAARFGETQTIVLLGLIYGLVIGPAAVIARAAGNDFLAKRGMRELGSAWRPSDSRAPELEHVKQPF